MEILMFLGVCAVIVIIFILHSFFERKIGIKACKKSALNEFEFVQEISPDSFLWHLSRMDGILERFNLHYEDIGLTEQRIRALKKKGCMFMAKECLKRLRRTKDCSAPDYESDYHNVFHYMAEGIFTLDQIASSEAEMDGFLKNIYIATARKMFRNTVIYLSEKGISFSEIGLTVKINEEQVISLLGEQELQPQD